MQAPERPRGSTRLHLADELALSLMWRARRRENSGDSEIPQIAREGPPPGEVVADRDKEGTDRPAPLAHRESQAGGSEHLAHQPDGSDQTAVLGSSGDIEVEDAVEGDHHAEAGADLGALGGR